MTMWDDRPVLDQQTRHRLEHVAAAVLEMGQLPATRRGPSWHPVDMWIGDGSAAVLFLAQDSYYVATAARTPAGRWHVTGGGWAWGDLHLDELVHRPKTPGLIRFGAGTSGTLRTTVGVASKEVASIRFYAAGRTVERPVPNERLFLLATTHDDPITYAIGVDEHGDALPADALLL